MMSSSTTATGGTMADAKTTTTSSGDNAPQSLDDPIRVRDLPSPATNPNLPRSMFNDTVSGAAHVDAANYVSVTDATHIPGDGFKEKSIKAQAIQMNTGFDANGQTGNAGDWL